MRERAELTIEYNIPIPAADRSVARPIKWKRYAADMRPGGSIGGLDIRGAHALSHALLRIYGRGSALQRAYSFGLYRVWRV